jgi:2'-5' RNA ligase
MYLTGSEGEALQALRQILDPVQAGLIPAHVTLCREDEIGRMPAADIAANLQRYSARSITLRFGRPVNFGGHGLLLPCVAGAQGFDALRSQVLGTAAIRTHEPHITLAHPRNPPPANEHLTHAGSLPENLSFTLATIVLIEQAEAGLPWKVLQVLPLIA